MSIFQIKKYKKTHQKRHKWEWVSEYNNQGYNYGKQCFNENAKQAQVIKIIIKYDQVLLEQKPQQEQKSNKKVIN